MSVEDPFFVVREDVEMSVKTCHELERQWHKILDEESIAKYEEYDRVCNELKNNIRSIEWDLEDLDETIGVVESNSFKFRVTNEELEKRKRFISDTRNFVQDVKGELNSSVNQEKAERVTRKSLLYSSNEKNKLSYNPDTILDIEYSPENKPFNNQQQQRLMFPHQDDEVGLVANSVGVLKDMSKSLGNELDQQSIILNHLETEMQNTRYQMDSILANMSKITHLSTSRKQWCAVGFLSSSIFVIFLLFIV